VKQRLCPRGFQRVHPEVHRVGVHLQYLETAMATVRFAVAAGLDLPEVGIAEPG